MITIKTLLVVGVIVLSQQSSFTQYNIFESQNLNHYRASFIRTIDNGYLIAASRDCYTPGAITIEGCPYKTLLIKTDDQGDTIWTNLYYETGIEQIFENADGTYTYLKRNHSSQICHQILVGLWGLANWSIGNIDAYGNIINEFLFPPECDYSLKSFDRLSEDVYVVLAEYEDIVESWNSSLNLFLLTRDGQVSNTKYFPFSSTPNTRLHVTAEQEILFLYADTADVLHLNIYDSSLNLLLELENESLSSACFFDWYEDIDIRKLADEKYLVTCYDRMQGGTDVHFFVFNNDLEVLSTYNHWLVQPTPLVLSKDDMIVIASQKEQDISDIDIQMNYFTLEGQFLDSVIVELPESQQPHQIIEIPNGDWAITGTINCCNEADSVGPGRSFIYLGSFPTSVDEVLDPSLFTVIPNPFTDQIHLKLDRFLDGTISYQLYSVSGEFLDEKTITSGEILIKTSGIPSGIYIVSLTRNNKIISRQRVIKM